MRYGDFRWIDIEAMDKDRVVVICPLASLEQHGHHLPLLTDTYLVTEVAERAEAVLQDSALLTPTLWLGASDHHLDFAGTLTVPNTLYVEMIKNLVRCFVQAGFQRLLFLNGHGGNIAPAQVAITEMVNSCEACESALIAFSSYWTLAEDQFSPERHDLDSQQLSHACEYETSMMLATKEGLVHLEDAQSGPPTIDSPFFHSEHGGRVTLARRFRNMTKSGSLGQPDSATAEKGESLLRAATGEVVSFVREFQTWPKPKIV